MYISSIYNITYYVLYCNYSVKVHGTSRWNSPSTCDNGDRCQYAHTLLEQMYHPNIYKTSMCINYINANGNKCQWEQFCTHAHGSQDIRNTNKTKKNKNTDKQYRSPVRNGNTFDTNKNIHRSQVFISLFYSNVCSLYLYLQHYSFYIDLYSFVVCFPTLFQQLSESTNDKRLNVNSAVFIPFDTAQQYYKMGVSPVKNSDSFRPYQRPPRMFNTPPVRFTNAVQNMQQMTLNPAYYQQQTVHHLEARPDTIPSSRSHQQLLHSNLVYGNPTFAPTNYPPYIESGFATRTSRSKSLGTISQTITNFMAAPKDVFPLDSNFVVCDYSPVPPLLTSRPTNEAYGGTCALTNTVSGQSLSLTPPPPKAQEFFNTGLKIVSDVGGHRTRKKRANTMPELTAKELLSPTSAAHNIFTDKGIHLTSPTEDLLSNPYLDSSLLWKVRSTDEREDSDRFAVTSPGSKALMQAMMKPYELPSTPPLPTDVELLRAKLADVMMQNKKLRQMVMVGICMSLFLCVSYCCFVCCLFSHS